MKSIKHEMKNSTLLVLRIWCIYSLCLKILSCTQETKKHVFVNVCIKKQSGTAVCKIYDEYVTYTPTQFVKACQVMGICQGVTLTIRMSFPLKSHKTAPL